MHSITRFVTTTISTIVLFAAISSAYADEVVDLTQIDQQQLNCLAENIYHEAGAEPYDGKVAVAQVTMNRANSGDFPDTICGVVQQKTKMSTGKTVCQFSWFCERKSPPKKLTLLWEQCYDIALAVFNGDTHNEKLGETAMYFHNTRVNPGWGLRRLTKIGGHIFYSNEKVRVAVR